MIVVGAEDHGLIAEHRIPSGKMHIYEESIRVPLEMRGPGIPRGVTIDPLAINADLAPTIVDAADVTPGLDMDGHSLLPVIQRPATDRNRDLLIEEPDVKAIRTPRYLYAEYDHGEQELYDLLHDPNELQSLDKSAAYASVESTLRFRLHQLERCAGQSCVMNKPDPPAP